MIIYMLNKIQSQDSEQEKWIRDIKKLILEKNEFNNLSESYNISINKQT